MKFCEKFITIQGEGKYVGVPSLFLRTTGCNLRCEWKNPDGSISRCDTPYTSWAPEAAKFDETPESIVEFLKQYPGVRHIVITGGEPTIQPELETFVSDEALSDYCITVETNGTIYRNMVDAFVSISPKLVSSTPANGPERNMHMKSRFNADAVARYIEDNEGQLKFVYSNKKDIREIDEFLKNVCCGDDKPVRYLSSLGWSIYLMPQGVNDKVLTENMQEAVKIAIKRGWLITDRLHIRIWGHRRNV